MIKKMSELFILSGLVLALFSCAPVTIETIPSGAAVYAADGETQLGTAPFDTRVWFTEKDLIVRQNRYFDAPVKLDFDSPAKVMVGLRPVPVSVYSKPLADIYPVGSDTPIGTTPMKISVGSKPAEYILKVADYYDQTVSVGIESPDPLVVELARRPIVTVSTEPSGVEIYEDDKLLGTGSVRIEVLSPRTIDLRKAGYFTQRGILAGAPPYEIHAALRPFPVITVSATPAAAKILRDGELLGTGSAQLAVGAETALNISADRYYPQDITLTPESSDQISVLLKAMPYVMINSEPSGADVMINGKSVGVTPVEQLIEKDTVVELSKEGFVTQTATLTGADSQVTLTLETIPVVTPEPNAVVETAMPDETPVEETAAPSTGISPLVWAGIAAAAAAGLVILILMKKKKK